MDLNPKGIISTVYSVVQEIVAALSGTGSSISEMAKPATLTHRVIIEESLANNDIMLSLMSMLNQQVAGYVLTAIQLSKVVSGSKTVRDIINTVATESYVDSVDLISLDGIPKSEIKDTVTLENINTLSVTNVELVGIPGMEGTQIVDMEAKSSRLLSTRVLEVDLTVPGAKADDTKHMVIRLGIHLVPFFVNTEIMVQLFNITNRPSVFLRWKQMLAGEISFFRDFVLALDLLEKYSKALRTDKSNKLGEILHNTRSSEMRGIAEAFSNVKVKSSNLASTIIVVDKQTIKKNLTDTGTDLTSFITRNKFFKASMSLMLVIVDDMFNNVEIYYNGLKSYTTCSFAMMNRVGQKSDSYDLKDILTAFNSNQNIRYR